MIEYSKLFNIYILNTNNRKKKSGDSWRDYAKRESATKDGLKKKASRADG